MPLDAEAISKEAVLCLLSTEFNLDLRSFMWLQDSTAEMPLGLGVVAQVHDICLLAAIKVCGCFSCRSVTGGVIYCSLAQTLMPSGAHTSRGMRKGGERMRERQIDRGKRMSFRR